MRKSFDFSPYVRKGKTLDLVPVFLSCRLDPGITQTLAIKQE